MQRYVTWRGYTAIIVVPLFNPSLFMVNVLCW